MANIKQTLDTAKKKIKKAAIIGGVGLASLAPLKSGAQNLNQDDTEKQKLEVVLDTLRMGIEVKNVSSKNKPLTLTVLDSNTLYSFINHKYYSRTDGVDKKGGYSLVDNRLIKKVDENSYEYNTDLMHDRYLSIIQKVFAVNSEMPLVVVVTGKYSAIRATDSDADRYYYVIVNDKEEFIYADIFAVNFTAFNRRQGLGVETGVGTLYITGKESQEKFPLKSDGSGFINNPPNNMIKSQQIPSIDNSNSR